MRRSPLLVLLSLCVAAAAAAEGARPKQTGGRQRAHSRSGVEEQGGAKDRPAAVPVLTESNLFEHERYWPYRVALAAPFEPADRERALPPGTPGVLIRLEDPDTALIDFAKLGVHRVPVGRTNLVDEANAVAAGRTHKFGPNLIVAIGPRLHASAAGGTRRVQYPDLAESKAFVCVFADPAGAGFGELAKALARLQQTEGVTTVLFPQGEHPDASVHEKLRAAGWETAFVLDRLSEMYTKSLLVHSSIPAVTLSTPEGRVLFQGEWQADALPALEAAIRNHLTEQPRTDEILASETSLGD